MGVERPAAQNSVLTTDWLLSQWDPRKRSWHLGGLGKRDFLLLPLPPFLDYSSVRVGGGQLPVKACSESYPLNIVFNGISNTNDLPLHTHFSFLDYFLKSHTYLIKKLIMQSYSDRKETYVQLACSVFQRRGIKDLYHKFIYKLSRMLKLSFIPFLFYFIPFF